MPTAAVYVRVSTQEQTTQNQLGELRSMAARRGWEVVAVYEEVASGAKRRPVLEQVRRDAGRAFDTLLVWAVDRLGRGGALEALSLLDELARKGVAVVSAQETWLDMTSPMRDVLTAFAATVARMERERLVERTRAGLRRARSQGVRLGRPPASIVLLRAAADAVAGGVAVAEAARRHGVHRTSLRRHLMAQNAPSADQRG